MRVTQGMRDASAREASTSASRKLLESSNRAATGKRVRSPLDDPGGFSRIASQSGGLGVLNSRQRAISRAEGALTAAESALASAADLIARAREIATQMADGTVSASDRVSAANDVTQLRQALVGVANTQVGGVYVFGGTRTQAAPVDAAGTFVGDGNAIEVEIADGIRIRANASGEQAFTAAGGRDVFADLATFATALATNDVPTIQASLAVLDTGHQQITRVRSDAGIGMDRLRTATVVTRSAETALQSLKADEEEVEAVEAFAELSQAQAAYDRALEITRRMLSTFQAEKLLP